MLILMVIWLDYNFNLLGVFDVKGYRCIFCGKVLRFYDDVLVEVMGVKVRILFELLGSIIK